MLPDPDAIPEPESAIEPESGWLKARRKSWARLIRRVYDTDAIPARAPPRVDDYAHDPFPDYGPQ